eukprot:TRINITY_DN68982_c0_g1_i1.p2 TRINITY_DN68982_c0_g1~~TRINITY_DN68982_c0_g1_i1.p2  ORF type:complete len:105 (+),score=24.38 TRINITY_DN68982_c0_g1_i1:156-470(+)
MALSISSIANFMSTSQGKQRKTRFMIQVAVLVLLILVVGTDPTQIAFALIGAACYYFLQMCNHPVRRAPPPARERPVVLVPVVRAAFVNATPAEQPPAPVANGE